MAKASPATVGFTWRSEPYVSRRINSGALLRTLPPGEPSAASFARLGACALWSIDLLYPMLALFSVAWAMSGVRERHLPNELAEICVVRRPPLFLRNCLLPFCLCLVVRLYEVSICKRHHNHNDTVRAIKGSRGNWVSELSLLRNSPPALGNSQRWQPLCKPSALGA